MRFIVLALSVAFLTQLTHAQEPPKAPPKDKTSELQKRCVEDPKSCQEKKAARKQKQLSKKEWCDKYTAACQEFKPIQAQATSPAKREARQAWCKKYPEACADWKKITQTTPQSKQ